METSVLSAVVAPNCYVTATAPASIWTPLNLATKGGKPYPGQLVALQLVPTDDTSFVAEIFDIGSFGINAKTGRKLWWNGTQGVQDPRKLSKNYKISWYPIAWPE